MPKVMCVMSYGFCSKFRMLSSSVLRFDKVTESLKVGTFLRYSVDIVCTILT